MTDGPRLQDGLPVESTEARFAGRSGVIDEDVNALQHEHDAVMVVRVHVTGVGVKTIKGDVTRLPSVKVLEARVVHDAATRGRLLQALGFDGADETTPVSVPASPEVPEVPEGDYTLFDGLDEPADEDVAMSDGTRGTPEEPIGQNVGRIRQSSNKALARFLEQA